MSLASSRTWSTLHLQLDKADNEARDKVSLAGESRSQKLGHKPRRELGRFFIFNSTKLTTKLATKFPLRVRVAPKNLIVSFVANLVASLILLSSPRAAGMNSAATGKVSIPLSGTDDKARDEGLKASNPPKLYRKLRRKLSRLFSPLLSFETAGWNLIATGEISTKLTTKLATKVRRFPYCRGTFQSFVAMRIDLIPSRECKSSAGGCKSELRSQPTTSARDGEMEGEGILVLALT